MPENNQHRNVPNRQSGHGSAYGQSRQGRPGGQRRQGQPNGKRPAPNRQGQRRSRKEQENAAALSSAVKGIIAIMLTFLIVIVVIMLFWKNLFTGSETGQKATGTITSTSYDPPETKTATEREETSKTTKKKTTRADDEEGSGSGDEQTIRCTGAVLLHPEPSSSSATLATIPAGADVTFYRNENNWYYVEYNGQEGYAWGNYFTAPAEN